MTLRYNYYFQAKGKQKEAMVLFHALPGTNPEVCKDCKRYCEDAPPHGVATRGILAMAHENLSFYEPKYT